MATVTGTNTFSIQMQQLLAYGPGGLQSTNPPIPFIIRSLFKTSGSLADQCNLISTNTLNLVASTPQSLNLTTLLDIYAATADFACVRLIALRNNSNTDGAIVLLGASGTHDWLGMSAGAATTTLNLYPSTSNNDGAIVWQMPGTTGAVVDATHNIIKFDPQTAAMTVDYLIAGHN